MAYDAVVIGAGVNGLAAAVHLAAKGWKVAVVERADVAGGAVKTREITRPGFRHDLYAMNLGLFAGSPFFAAHKDRLLAQGLGFVTAKHCFASAFPDGSWLGIEKDPEANAQRIAALSTADAARWRAMMRRTFLESLARRCRPGRPRARSLLPGARAAPTGSPTPRGYSHRHRASGSMRISRTTSSRPRSRCGACISTSRRMSPVARCFPIWKRWPIRFSAWRSARAASTPSSPR